MSDEPFEQAARLLPRRGGGGGWGGAARPAKEWGIDVVVGWLRDPEGPVHAAFTGQADELARLAEAFQAEEVDGDLLLKYDRPSLKADFGLTAGKANKLAAAIEALAAHDRLQLQPGGSGALSEAEEVALMAEADRSSSSTSFWRASSRA